MKVRDKIEGKEEKYWNSGGRKKEKKTGRKCSIRSSKREHGRV